MDDWEEELERAQLAQMQQDLNSQKSFSTQISQKVLNDTKDWIKLYPLYFDSTKSQNQGRKIPSSLGMPNPSFIYILDAINQLGVECVFEAEKRHPRDPFLLGRFRINLASSRFKSKRALMLEIGRQLRDPDLVERVNAREPQIGQLVAHTTGQVVGPIDMTTGMPIAASSSGSNASSQVPPKKGKKARK